MNACDLPPAAETVVVPRAVDGEQGCSCRCAALLD